MGTCDEPGLASLGLVYSPLGRGTGHTLRNWSRSLLEKQASQLQGSSSSFFPTFKVKARVSAFCMMKRAENNDYSYRVNDEMSCFNIVHCLFHSCQFYAAFLHVSSRSSSNQHQITCKPVKKTMYSLLLKRARDSSYFPLVKSNHCSNFLFYNSYLLTFLQVFFLVAWTY